MNKDDLIKRLVTLCQGYGGAIAIRLSDWQAIRDAYGDTPLLKRIAGNALAIHPVANVHTGEIGFKEQRANE